MAFKARPQSSIKVPSDVPNWKQALWRKVWRASFLVLGDEQQALRIANAVTSPDAVKESFVTIPADVPDNCHKVWAKVFASCKDCKCDIKTSKQIAYKVTGQKQLEPPAPKNYINSKSGKVKKNHMGKKSVGIADPVSNSVLTHRFGGLINISERPKSAIKSEATGSIPAEYQGWVEGYLVSWGSTRDTDLQGEYFTPNTEFCLDWFGERPVLYHHGMDDSTGLKKIGSFVTIKADPIGLWVQAQLDLRDKYARAVYDMVAAKQFGWSSGSVDHLVKIAENGEIMVWPLIEGSITPTPAQPAKTAVRPIKGIVLPEQNYITMQAFKAVLMDDETYQDYLRGLDAHLRNYDRVGEAGTGASKSVKLHRSNYGEQQAMSRYDDSAVQISRAVAKALGVKDITDDELAAVASEVGEVVEDEISAAAIEALEEEALTTAKSVKTMQPKRVPTQARQAANQRSAKASNNTNLTVKSDSIRNAENIEAVMMNEIAAAMEDEAMEAQAARALRRRAWKRAIRQIAESPDGNVPLGDVAFENARPLASDTLPGGKYYGRQSAARNYGYRQAEVDATMQDALMDDEAFLGDEAFMDDEALLGDDAFMQDEAIMSGLTDPQFKNYRRGIRQAQPDEAVMNEEVIGDVATASYRRGFRSGLRSAYRQIEQNVDAKAAETEAVMSEEALVASKTGDGDVVEEAVRAYRAGYHRGLKRAIRQIEEETKAEDMPAKHYYRSTEPFQPAPTATEYAEAPTGYEPLPSSGVNTDVKSRQAARGYAYRQAEIAAMQDELAAMQSDLATMQDPEAVAQDPAMAQDPVLAKFYNRRQSQASRGYAYRQAEVAAMQDQIAAMQDQISTMQDPAAVAQDPMLGKSYRNRRPVRGYGYRQVDPAIAQDAMMQDDEFATQQDPLAKSYRNRQGYRNYGYRQAEIAAMQDDAMMQDALMQDALMQDDAFAQDEDFAAMSEVPMGGKAYRSPAYRSADPYAQALFWKRRALELETMEAPGQRAFKSMGVKDVADRPGAYENAFKSYIYKGLGLMTDQEKYVLQGKGKARWENSTFAFDSATKSVKTYNSSSDASVGFLVPEDWVNELNKNIMTQTVMAPECRTRTTTSDRIVQPSIRTTDARRAHAAQVRWPGESPSSNQEHRSDEDQYNQITIPIHVMLISLAATNSALEDSTFNLEEEINESFAEAVAVSYDQLIWGGDGQNKMQGIVVNGDVTGSRSLGVSTVGGYIPSGSKDGIVTADVLKTMQFHLPQGYRSRAKWYMNSNTGLEIATLKDGEGNYLIDLRDEGLRSAGIPDRLLGRPIVYNEWASDIAEDAFPIVLADLSRGYVIGRRVEFSVRRFDDSNYAEHDQVLFLGRARLGGQVSMPAAFKVLKVAAS